MPQDVSVSRVLLLVNTHGVRKMRISTLKADSPSELVQALTAESIAPDFVALHMSADHNASDVQAAAKPGMALHGGTSCRGIMTQAGHHTKTGTGLGAFCIFDPEGDYGTGLANLGDDARAAAAQATQDALDQADRAGEAPDLIWLSVTPGQEESVIAGIQDIVGDGVPVLGGSAADNDISGNWQVFDTTNTSPDGVVVSVLFPSSRVSFAYQNGYVPTATTGTVTKVDGRRVVEIDNEPAAAVYAKWAGQTVPETGSDMILSASTFAPLGRDAFTLKGVPYYLLAHPSALNSDGSMDMFAETQVGEVLTLMHGDANELAARAGRVVGQAATVLTESVAGVLVVFCGGCMLGVQDKMDQVVEGVQSTLPDTPFMGVFTFGEQGPLRGQGNRHGNLMVSAIVFGA